MINKLLLLLLFPVLIFAQSSLDAIDKLIENNSFVLAEKQLKTYLLTNSENLKTTELQGDIFGHKKQWDSAIAEYKKLVDAQPKIANYHYKYGGALGMKALSINKMKALTIIPDLKDAFINAANLDPKHIEARWALVELFMQLPSIIGGSKSKSLTYANELENLSKVDGYLAKGYIYEYDNEPELAEKYYKKAIVVGGSVTCYNKLAEFYNKEEQPENAIRTIEEAQAKHQRNALHYQIGKVCTDYNIQLDKGERCLNTFIENHTAKDTISLEWAYYRLAKLYRHKNDKNKALSVINKALSIRENFKEAKEEKEEIMDM